MKFGVVVLRFNNSLQNFQWTLSIIFTFEKPQISQP